MEIVLSYILLSDKIYALSNRIMHNLQISKNLLGFLCLYIPELLLPLGKVFYSWLK